MADFDFSPEFNSDVKAELDRRMGLMETKDSEWNYRKYAYFYIESIKSTITANNSDSDFLPIFALLPDGDLRIGTVEPSGYLKAFHSDENDIRTLKPVLTSATIKATGGGDLYNAYISEVDVSFKVYTLDDLEKVQNELFTLGAKVRVSYGWLGENNPNILNGELIINVYNFGFTMSSDGTFDCKINGLTEGVFMGSQSISGTVSLSDGETNALGTNAANPATLPQALLSKAYSLFGVTDGDTSNVDGLSSVGVMISIEDTADETTYYMSLLNEIVNTNELKQIVTPYISFGDLVKFINKSVNDNEVRFNFHTDSNLVEIKSSTPESIYGSADPRKFIFPNNMAKYGENSNFVQTVPNEYKIQNILVSIWVVSFYYDSLSKRKNEKLIPPDMSSLIRALSNDINRLSGGLVDIQVAPEQESGEPSNTKFKNKYQIFNNTEVQKKESPSDPYLFEVLSKKSIVKEVSIDTDFDVDTMLIMSINRVKRGEFNIKPLEKLYPTLRNKLNNLNRFLAPLQPQQQTNTVNNLFVIPGLTSPSKETITKLNIIDTGISDNKATNVADIMRKALTGDNKQGTFISLPFYIKLGVTLDGINGIGFLQPISVDRLPQNYRDNVKFLITGVEHSFDGQGGWETKLDTAMKVGK
tara:strand:- start:204 stop:2132 length:1929 start_codon:yes stop_codon:yes gene_type:complete